MIIDDSAFFEAPAQEEVFAAQSFEELEGRESSPCAIYRFKRAGRFRILKCLKPQYRGKPLYEELLRKEFEIIWNLSHENICQCYSFGEFPGLGRCIEMEWIDGRSLQDMMERGEVTSAFARNIVSEICDALSYMHSKQVIHRDIKPSNVLVTYKGNNVKLIDFGLSDSDSHYVLKESAGSRRYAAPEVLGGQPATPQSDIYSLGRIMEELSPELRGVARRCCCQDPRGRFRTADEVKEALRRRRASLFPVILTTVAAVAVFFSLLLWNHPAPAPAIPIPSEAVPSDTLSVISDSSTVIPDSDRESPTPSAVIPPPSTVIPDAGRESPVCEKDLDSLFRSATEAFAPR